eukprot:1499359-Prorocentrum_lima.AAC.1
MRPCSASRLQSDVFGGTHRRGPRVPHGPLTPVRVARCTLSIASSILEITSESKSILAEKGSR